MISEFEAWWDTLWPGSYTCKQDAKEAWNAALDAAVHKVKISNNPDHLIELLKATKHD